MMSTGVVASKSFGNWDDGMFPTRRCTCLGNAKMHSPNDDWYCTMGAMLPGIMSMMLVLSVMCIRCIDLTATCGRWVLVCHSASLTTVLNLKCPKVSGACRNHFLPSHCHIVLALQSRYHRCWWWYCLCHCPSCCVRTPSHDSSSSTACLLAFHDVVLCWTGHSHLMLRF
jgi:hypothetical protein